MNRFVLDCSVTMAWCFEDQANDYTEKVLESLSKTTAIVPHLWILEVTNVLLMAERRKKITPSESSRFFELLNQLPIMIATEKESRLDETFISLGRTYQLSSYDSSYLHLAMGDGLPLATRDKSLMAACKKSGVKIY